MDQLIELLKEVNIAQIFIILAGVWTFYNRLDNKIQKLNDKLDNKIEQLDDKLDNKIEQLDDKIDKLGERVEDIDRRLCRIEGGLATHGHCLFNQSKPDQKAQ